MSDSCGAIPTIATDTELDLVLARLSNLQRLVVQVGISYSSTQRNRLIDKGIVDPDR